MSWHKWKYKYLSIVFLSWVFAAYLLSNQSFHAFLLNLGTMQYIGALVAGFLFVSSFSVATAIVIIGILAAELHPLELGLLGGIGAVVGDLIIFRIVKEHLLEELSSFFGKTGTSHIKLIVHSKYIGWTLPIIGIFILASPLPNELGVSLLGISKMSETNFILISFVTNAFAILTVAAIIRVF